MSEIVTKDPIKKYRAIFEAEVIDCDSFDFNEMVVEVKVSMIWLVWLWFYWDYFYMKYTFKFIMIPKQLCLMIIHHFIMFWKESF